MNECDKSEPLDEVGINVSAANPKLPRIVHFDSLSIKVLLGTWMMILFGLVVLVWASHDTVTGLHTRNILRVEGRTVDGTITKSTVNRGGTYVMYTFAVSGTLYAGQAEMETDHYNVPGDRNMIAIRYLPKDPHISQPIEWTWISIHDLFPLLLVLLITSVAVNANLIAWRGMALMRLGTITVGRVTGCVIENKLFRVYYDFNTADNIEVEGSSRVATEYQVGTSIPIIYLARNPKRNDRFPVAGFRVAAPARH